MNKILQCVFKNSALIGNKNVSSICLFSSSVNYRDSYSETSQVSPAYQSVADFYAGKSVFLTGATGFIGRLLIERLLFTCKDIEKVYILIRAKKNASVQDRLQELLQNPIFTKLKDTKPQDLNKIVPIAGDVNEAMLGMNHEDEKTLIEKVSVIFHSAANVKFKASLSEVMQVNYEGTKKVMELGKKTKNLDMFVHVSTAFKDSLDCLIDEIPYPAPKNIEHVYKILANHSNESQKIRELLDKAKNTYVFSKNMSEAYVASNYGNMQTVIIRPAMITSVYKEPLVGYTDSWVTGTGLMCDIASGLIRVVYGKKDVAVQIIPADYVCNFLIVAAAKASRSKKCNVYNLTTGHANPINWRKATDIYIREGKKQGYVIMPFPAVLFTNVSWAVPILRFLTQTLPSAAADTWLRLTKRKPRYMKLQKHATARAILSEPVTVVPWVVKTTQARDVISTLDIKDKNKFPCDPVTVNWDEYIPIYCKGVKYYMLDKNNQKGNN